MGILGSFLLQRADNLILDLLMSSNHALLLLVTQGRQEIAHAAKSREESNFFHSPLSGNKQEEGPEVSVDTDDDVFTSYTKEPRQKDK